MADNLQFRCYYDDGTIVISDYCPLTNSNGSSLLKSEATLIEDVTGHVQWPWFLIIILGIMLLSKKKG